MNPIATKRGNNWLTTVQKTTDRSKPFRRPLHQMQTIMGALMGTETRPITNNERCLEDLNSVCCSSIWSASRSLGWPCGVRARVLPRRLKQIAPREGICFS